MAMVTEWVLLRDQGKVMMTDQAMVMEWVLVLPRGQEWASEWDSLKV